MTTTIPLRLPNDGVFYSDFGYKVLNMSMKMRYSATATFSWVINLVKIGQETIYSFGEDASTLYTVANGPRNIKSDKTTILSLFRPGKIK